MSASPIAQLTRHFIGAIMAPPLLTELGVDYWRRTLTSLLAILLVIGIFLPRTFSSKYIDLGRLTSAEPYLRALQADTLLMIAVPMLIVGLAAIVLSPMLFPDEIDYRVLTPLPVSRLQLFIAKFAAVAIIIVVAVTAVNLISSVWFPFVTGGWRVKQPLWARVGAHALATVAASLWMFSAVMALQGIVHTILPAKLRRRIGLLMQASLFVLLLLSIPFVFRFPTLEVSSRTVSELPLILLPPTWFMAMAQSMLDDDQAGGYAQVAALAGAAFATTTLIIVISSLMLYRSAERLAGMPMTGRDATDRTIVSAIERRGWIRSATAAVTAFAYMGLARSRLHQFVFLLILGVGLALVVENAIRGTTLTALTAPLLTSLSIVLALRTAFLLPLDRNGAWMFRLTEDERTRADVLDGVTYAVRSVTLLGSLGVSLLVQPAILHQSTWLALPLTAIANLILVEFVFSDWCRIPFTCSYLPGKRVMAYTLGVLFTAYVVFVLAGAGLIAWSITRPGRVLLTGAMLIAVLVVMRRARLRSWGRSPLEFEDEDPLGVRTLGLMTDERPSGLR